MTPQPSPETPSRFEVRLTSDSHFSWIRTRLSLERTLMSWVRTSTALIGFGFTIVQFFERVSQMEGVRQALRPQMPRYLGLALIASGVIALAISAWQYRRVIAYLNSKPFQPLSAAQDLHGHSPLLFIAMLLMLIGLLAFVSVLFRFF